MSTASESFGPAHEMIERSVRDRTCPFCKQSNWEATNTLDSADVVSISSSAQSDSAPDRVEKWPEDGPEIISLGLNHAKAIGFVCTTCGFIRFHRVQ